MSDDEIPLVSEWQRLGDVADFDQLHAGALELLRHCDAFVLVTTRADSNYIASVHAVPENRPEGRSLLLATIDVARRALAARNRRQHG